MFAKNVSNNSKSSSSKSNESKKKKNKLLDFLKNGFLDYSLDSNSNLSYKESADKNEENEEETKKTKKNKNFILKSELFSSFESDKKMKSEKVSPKPSLL